MKSKRKNVSTDGHTVTRRRITLLSIPYDLILEVLSRLPVKSIARCRCVSRIWASILIRQDFTELFLTKSSARRPHQLLFSCRKDSQLFFFSSSSPHPIRNLDVNNSSLVLTANHLTHFPLSCSNDGMFISTIRGLVCVMNELIVKVRKKKAPVIYNPSTGQSLVLPKVKTRRVNGVTSYFGYDPIDKQFKVLAMTSRMAIGEWDFREHQVLTLGTEKPSWRMIECCIPHYSPHKGICVNGVLYYLAMQYGLDLERYIIVCFYVRFETFSFIKATETFWFGTLINYNGKLGLLMTEEFRYKSIELRVLEDAEKQEWSNYTYVLSPSCRNIIGNTHLHIVGVIGTNEIVLSSSSDFRRDTLCIFYYNIERNTMVKVAMQGMDAFKYLKVHTFLNHVENVKLM